MKENVSTGTFSTGLNTGTVYSAEIWQLKTISLLISKKLKTFSKSWQFSQKDVKQHKRFLNFNPTKAFLNTGTREIWPVKMSNMAETTFFCTELEQNFVCEFDAFTWRGTVGDKQNFLNSILFN